MQFNTILEICTNSIRSVIHAHQGGATRIELCSNLEQGGTTPSAGMIVLARKIPIETFVLIRPRIGDFVYNDAEYQTILSDIEFCKESGCQGVVIGFLDKNGRIDEAKTKEAVRLAHPMQVTFHRAFDCVNDPFQALEAIIETGCHRILTSGLAPKAVEGKMLLKKLIAQANNRISIMAGSGVGYNNVKELFDVGIREFHASASVFIENKTDAATDVAKEFYLPYRETQLNHVQLLVQLLQQLENEI